MCFIFSQATVQSHIFSENYVASVRHLRHQSYNILSFFNTGGQFTTNSTYITFDGVPVLFYEPFNKSSKLQPAFIYIHGGGKAYGSIGIIDWRQKQM